MLIKSLKIKVIRFTFIILCCNLHFSQNINPIELNDEIFFLNNKSLQEKSILKIYEVLDDPESTPYDRYHALLQKSNTYKSVFNYTEAYNNLKLALEEGQKSNKRKEVESKVLIEKFFIIFDLQREKEIKEFLSKNNNLINLNLVDGATKALYLTAIATLEIEDGNYISGNIKIDEAIEIYKRTSPKDLPNIYSKKMFYYSKINDAKNFDKYYDSAMIYAEKYNVILYKKDISNFASEFYIKRKEFDKAMIYKNIADNLKYDSNSTFNMASLELLNLEKKIQQQKLDEKTRKKDQLIYSIIIAVIGFVLILFLAKKIISNKKALKDKKEQNTNQIDNIIFSSNENTDNIELENYEHKNLTDRQKEIIKLVQEGQTNKEIAIALNISENTVKYHLKNIYNILEIESRIEL